MQVSASPPVAVEPATVAALAALHDIGKFTRAFQGKVEPPWLDCLGPTRRRLPVGRMTRRDTRCCWGLAERIGPLFGSRGSAFGWSSILAAVACHHGRPPAEL
jgi:HD domain